jgi:acetyl-CoA carboxylase carboxyl transferase subunit beta
VTPRPIVAVGAVARRADQLLLVRRGHGPAAGMWSVPGGRVELHETLHEALVREVREETGLGVVVDAFLGWVERLPENGDDRGEHFVILDFAVTPLDAEVEPAAGDDAAEAAWVEIADLGDYRLVPGLLDFLEEVGALSP